jgi:type III secretory pathway component EscV
MIEIIGIISVCILINSVSLLSVIYFGIGIGILEALNYITQQKIQISKAFLLSLESASTIFISLSLLSEVSLPYVISIAAGICMFYVLYNLKKSNKISSFILLAVACLLIDIAIFNVLNIFRFIIFAICMAGYLGFIYLKKPCDKEENADAEKEPELSERDTAAGDTKEAK